MLTRMRRAPCRSALVVCCLALLAVLLPAPSAGAATGYELTAGWLIQGATARCPGQPPRTLSAKHAAAFIESWYPATIFGSLKQGTPPPTLPVCKFVANDTIKYQVTNSSGKVVPKQGKYQFHALYASQGAKAWVGLPPQQVGPGAVVRRLVWFVATPRVTPAFLGKLDPVSKTPTSTTTTTTTPAPVKDTSSGSSSAPWIIGAVVAVVALLGAGAVVVRRRASTPSSTPSASSSPPS
jgi:hypothetical protein